MNENAGKLEANFANLREVVTGAVRECLNLDTKAQRHLIERLRMYERTARQAGFERQTLQVIASGRRLLGDR